MRQVAQQVAQQTAQPAPVWHVSHQAAALRGGLGVAHDEWASQLAQVSGERLQIAVALCEIRSMSDGINEKLLAAKLRWAKAARNFTGTTDPARANRLPPGQRLVANWPVLDLGVQPDVTAADWKLAVDGLVENPVSLTYAQLVALPQRESVSDIHCVTKWSRYDNHWVGVSARDLMVLARPKAEAAHVIFHAYDGYTTNVGIDVFAAGDVTIAHSWEGYPITRQHGGPVRIVIPRYYFWKSAKWVKRIEFSRDDKPGYWETRGYHNVGDPWLEERYE